MVAGVQTSHGTGQPRSRCTRVLSPENMALVDLIREARPQSVAELAKLSGRAKSNLSRTLHAMAGLGVIELRDEADGR